MDSSAFSFSPLFIGEVSSTLPLRRVRQDMLSFQSPLHWGSLFNDTKIEQSDDARRLFQSPLHWGSLFNGELAWSNGQLSLLSVPSSLGKSLQRSPKVRSRSRLMSFSPLFIGEVSSTELFLFGQRFRPPFSPLFIGEVSSTVSLYSLESSVQSFSPLFIGEVSSTVWRQHEVYAHRPFQSPLHWGSLFNVFS